MFEILNIYNLFITIIIIFSIKLILYIIKIFNSIYLLKLGKNNSKYDEKIDLENRFSKKKVSN